MSLHILKRERIIRAYYKVIPLFRPTEYKIKIMATIRIETQVTSNDLLQAVGQLSASDLERFASQVLRLQAQRKAASLSSLETELLLKINQGIPEAANTRYQSLQSKQQAEQLTKEERRELSRLINQREKLQAQRLESLAELARLRNTTLRGVMKQLGLQSPGYA
jgi:hypothetical protein